MFNNTPLFSITQKWLFFHLKQIPFHAQKNIFSLHWQLGFLGHNNTEESRTLPKI